MFQARTNSFPTPETNVITSPVFQGWENCPGGIVIRVTLVESVIHTLCCHNQMDNVRARKDGVLQYVTKATNLN